MINYKESEDIMKPKYKVIRWQTDGTEEIWDASQKANVSRDVQTN